MGFIELIISAFMTSITLVFVCIAFFIPFFLMGLAFFALVEFIMDRWGP